jgi:hypothetical protein
VVTVPFQMFPCRPNVLVVREPDLSALHDGQQKGSVAAFSKMTVGSNHGVVVGGNDADPEPSFPATLHSFRVGGKFGSDRTIRWGSGFSQV